MGSSTLTVKKAPGFSRETASEEDTRALARALAVHLKFGDCLALVGELGTGKTVFVQGLGEALGVRTPPCSPTFALVQIHPAKSADGPALRHVDLYRLSACDVPCLEWEDLFDGRGITVIEWAEKAQGLWPARSLPIYFQHRAPDRRLVELHAYGERSQEIIEKMKKAPR